MKRSICVLLCCALALAVFPAVPAGAEDDYLLCVIENTFLDDPTEGGHAAYIGGMIYVPYRVLDNITGIRAYYNERLQQLFIYSLDLRMTFDLSNGQTYDTTGDFYPPLAVRRAGTVFIPIQFVCDRFSLWFSFTPAGQINPAPTIRICAAAPALSNTVLFARSTALMQSIYDRYLALQAPSGVTPDDPPDATPEEPEPLLTYLLFEGALTEQTGTILDTLADADMPAAFFLPAESPDAAPALLRRIYASGCAVGLLLTEVPDDPAALLQAGNARLCAVLHAKTRLVRVAGGSDSLTQAQRDAIIAAGFRLWDANIDPDAALSPADALLRSARRLLSRTSRTTVVRLHSNDAVAEALPELCRWLNGNGYSVLTMNEWDTPVNAASEIR